MVSIFKCFKRNKKSQKSGGLKQFLTNAYELLIKKRPRRTQNDEPPPVDVISKARIQTVQVIAHRVTAGIGGIYPLYCGRVKSFLFFFLWLFHLVVHFTLDFYESIMVFHPSWATSIAAFMITLVVCTIFTSRKSVPWFSKRIKKLNNEGLYPLTVKRVEVLMKVLPPLLPVLSISAAMGQFLCYYFDDALRINFNDVGVNGTSVTVVPDEVEFVVNVLRATSLIHVYFEFWHLLLFHLILMLMLQSSMAEFNERMYFKLREHPVDLTFAEAVDMFSSRVKFVKEGSDACTGVVLTLCLACSISFIINAYNYLFIKPFAIYIWFAIAPLIWLVVPLMGAAWVTKTYQKFKMVVVNSWVEIPDDEEKPEETEEKHGMAKIGQRLKNTIRRKSHSPEHDSTTSATSPTEKKFQSRKLSLQIPSSKTPVFRTSSLNSQASTSDTRSPLSSDSDDSVPKSPISDCRTSLSATWSPDSSSAWRNVRRNSWTPAGMGSTNTTIDEKTTDTPLESNNNSARGSASTSAESVSGVHLKVQNAGLATQRSQSDSSLPNSSSHRRGLPPLKLKKTKTTPLSAALEALRKKNGDVFEASEGEDGSGKEDCKVVLVSNRVSPETFDNNAKRSKSDTKLDKIDENSVTDLPMDLQCTLETLCESSDEAEEGVVRSKVEPILEEPSKTHETEKKKESSTKVDTVMQELDNEQLTQNKTEPSANVEPIVQELDREQLPRNENGSTSKVEPFVVVEEPIKKNDNENTSEPANKEAIETIETEDIGPAKPPSIPSVVIQMPSTDNNQNTKTASPKGKNSLGRVKGWGLFLRASKNPNLLSPINERYGGSSSEADQSDNEEPNAVMDKLRGGVGSVNLMRGIAKTLTKWRTKVKVKKKFNFEKYIMYLENILPDVGFVVGNVAISWDMVFLLCSLVFTLVGVFAQEAFFGN